MVAHVADFNVIVVQSEFEALVLENSLIKLHKPKYNILLKDDKGYPFVRLDVTQPYPTFSLVNRTEKDGAKYFGPYGGRSMTAEIIDTVCKTLRLPTCTRRFPRDIGRARPCLNYHMGTCAGYCLKDVTRAQYLQAIREAEMILDGRTAELTAELTERMQAAARPAARHRGAEKPPARHRHGLRRYGRRRLCARGKVLLHRAALYRRQPHGQGQILP